MAGKERIVYVLGDYHVLIRYPADEDGLDTTDDIIRRYSGGKNSPIFFGGPDEVPVHVYKNQAGDLICKWSKTASLSLRMAKWWQFWKYFLKDSSPDYVDDVVEDACAWIEEAMGVDVLVQEKLRAIEEKIDSIGQGLVARETVAKEILALEDSSSPEDSGTDSGAPSRKLKQSDS